MKKKTDKKAWQAGAGNCARGFGLPRRKVKTKQGGGEGAEPKGVPAAAKSCGGKFS